MVQFYPTTTLFAFELTGCLKLNSQNAQISILLKSSYSGQLNVVFATKKSHFRLVNLKKILPAAQYDPKNTKKLSPLAIKVYKFTINTIFV